ncbi:MAG: tetratricopeptide repeat protein [Syntrophaceae bacterium]|nr:tetratricopeptide repeat protein [Syntrophaceae bacterium]
MISIFRCCFVVVISFVLTVSLNLTAAAQQNNPLTQSSEYAAEGQTSPIDEAAVDQLREMTPREIEELDKKLAEALTLYYDSEFGKALPIFNEISDRVETMDIMWWIGTSAMKAGKMELAMKKFKDMLAVNPNLHRVRLELATIHFKLGQYEEARKEIETVQSANPPEAVQQNIDKFLAAIEERTKKAFWNVRFSQGIMYVIRMQVPVPETES